MSIYATLWELQVKHPATDEWVELYAQAVPAHVDYTGPAWDAWLPPPVDPDGDVFRAVFICQEGATTKGTPRCGQEYVAPLLVFTGAEYQALGIDTLLERIEQAFWRQLPMAPVVGSSRP